MSDINGQLQRKTKLLEDIIAFLKESQIQEESHLARKSLIRRLRMCVESLDDAVTDLECAADI